MRLSLKAAPALATLAVLGLAAAHPQAAHAQLFTDSASFQSALASGSYTETFNGGGGIAAPSYAFSGGSGYAYTATATGVGGVFRGGGVISANLPAGNLVFTFTGSPVTALGGNFFSTDINNNVVASNVMLTLSNGQNITFTSPNASTFRGFISAVPILSLTENVTATRYATIDNFTVGAPVPEPSSVAAFAFTGLGALGLVLKARRRTA